MANAASLYCSYMGAVEVVVVEVLVVLVLLLVTKILVLANFFSARAKMSRAE